MTPERIEDEYLRMTSFELSTMYGLSHCAMRAYISRWGIADHKQAVHGDRIAQLWTRGTPADIAEFLDVTECAVIGVARYMGLISPGRSTSKQLALWPHFMYRTTEPRPITIQQRFAA